MILYLPSPTLVPLPTWINSPQPEPGPERPHNGAIAQHNSSTSPSRCIILDTFFVKSYTFVDDVQRSRKEVNGDAYR